MKADLWSLIVNVRKDFSMIIAILLLVKVVIIDVGLV